MSLALNLTNAFTRVATEFKAIRVALTGSGTGDTSGLATDSKNVVGAINEIYAGGGAGGVATLDDLTDVTVITPGTGQILRYDNGQWVNVDPDFASTLTPQEVLDLLEPVTETFGLDLLQTADAQALRTLLELHAVATSGNAADLSGLANVALSGSASDITIGTLPTSVLPALAIVDVFQVANEPNMLALDAQRGDVAVRTDLAKTFILSADAPGDLENWVELPSVGNIVSVNGQQGVVNLSWSDVGAQQADATLTALAALATSANKLIYATGVDTFTTTDLTAFGRQLLAVADAAAARTLLSVYSKAEIGDPETNFVTTFEQGLT